MQFTLLQAPPEFNIHQKFPHDESKSVKVMAFSADGQMMAWSNMASVKVAQEEGGKWSIKFELQQPKVFKIDDGDPLAFFSQTQFTR